MHNVSETQQKTQQAEKANGLPNFMGHFSCPNKIGKRLAIFLLCCRLLLMFSPHYAHQITWYVIARLLCQFILALCCHPPKWQQLGWKLIVYVILAIAAFSAAIAGNNINNNKTDFKNNDGEME